MDRLSGWRVEMSARTNVSNSICIPLVKKCVCVCVCVCDWVCVFEGGGWEGVMVHYFIFRRRAIDTVWVCVCVCHVWNSISQSGSALAWQRVGPVASSPCSLVCHFCRTWQPAKWQIIHTAHSIQERVWLSWPEIQSPNYKYIADYITEHETWQHRHDKWKQSELRTHLTGGPKVKIRTFLVEVLYCTLELRSLW